MPSKYEQQRRNRALLKKAFPDMKPPLLTKPQTLDEEKQTLDVKKKNQ